MKVDFYVENVGTERITIGHRTDQLRPIRWSIKMDGTKDDKPSFAMFGIGLGKKSAVMQISAEMFRPAYEAMKEIYEQEEKSN